MYALLLFDSINPMRASLLYLSKTQDKLIPISLFTSKMSRKHLPILFHKLSKLLRIFIFIAKMRKLSFDKYSSLVGKSQRNRKKLRFMEHYNYGFLGEYEFSPSNTTLIRYPRKQHKKNRGPRDFNSLFLLCRCWGGLRVLEGEDGEFAMEALPATQEANALALLEPLDWGSEEASIDMRAQRFIERFYEEMRMQRQESI